MTCDEFNSLLQNYLRLTNDPSALAEARRHAVGCSQCALKLDQTLRVEQELLQLSPIEPDGELLRCVMSRIEAASAKKHAVREGMGLAVGVAGFVLLAAAFLARYIGAASSIALPHLLVRGLDLRSGSHPSTWRIAVTGRPVNKCVR